MSSNERWQQGNIFHPSGEPAIDGAIERLERRLAAARQIRLIAREFPDLIADMFSARATDGTTPKPVNGAGAKERKRGGLANHLQIVKFFLDHDNQWHEAPRIGEALGLTRGTVATVLWTTRANLFDKRAVPGSIKKKAWRIKPDRIHELQTELEAAQRKEAESEDN